jgi:hypothetical protein
MPVIPATYKAKIEGLTCKTVLGENTRPYHKNMKSKRTEGVVKW